MKVDGRCHCGSVTFEAEVEPGKVVACHCTDCQTLSGTAFRVAVPTVMGTFRLLSGRVKVYVKTAESGNAREQSFCPECGTPVYSAPVGPDPRVMSLRVGALAQRDALVPRVQLWHRSAQHWLPELGAIAVLETQPVFGAGGQIDGGD